MSTDPVFDRLLEDVPSRPGIYSERGRMAIIKIRYNAVRPDSPLFKSAKRQTGWRIIRGILWRAIFGIDGKR